MTMEQVANPMLASSVYRYNWLVNGGFEWWQRGNGPFTAQSAFACDRWQINLDGTDTLSVSKDTTNVDTGSAAAAALTYTRGNGGNVTAFYQRVEDIYQMRGRTLTFTVRIRTSTANVARVNWSNQTARQTPSAYHTGNGVYQTLSSTYSSAPSDTVLMPTIEINNASATVYVDNATVVVGAVGADYVPLHISDELARCQRYYERLADDGDGTLIISLGNVTTVNTWVRGTFHFKVVKAVVPTATKVGTWSGAVTTGIVQVVGTKSLYFGGAAPGTGDQYLYNMSGGANITLEANP